MREEQKLERERTWRKRIENIERAGKGWGRKGGGGEGVGVVGWWGGGGVREC